MIIRKETVGWHSTPDDSYFKHFAAQTIRRMPPKAKVLDVGCGVRLHPDYSSIRERASAYWGCDVDPEAGTNPALDSFVAGDFVRAPLPLSHFDLIIATYVLEHLEDPSEFFQKARYALRSPGVFAFLTPNRRHPFCTCARVVERLGIKRLTHQAYGHTEDGSDRVNEYPAYYRANTVSQIALLAEQSGFKTATFNLVAAEWKYYFPYGLRFVTRIYDKLIAERREEGHLILVGFLGS